jgi:hypothetical protein
MNQLWIGETFCVRLSEFEVRMTMRELCGSKWYDYPFEGEVYENSFSITENHFGHRINLGGVVLEGSFYEEDGKTTIYISPKLKSSDIFAYLMFAIVSTGILCYGMTEMFLSLLLRGGEGFFPFFLAAVAGGISMGIVYSMVVGSYQRSIEKMKQAFRAAQRHKEK